MAIGIGDPGAEVVIVLRRLIVGITATQLGRGQDLPGEAKPVGAGVVPVIGIREDQRATPLAEDLQFLEATPARMAPIEFRRQGRRDFIAQTELQSPGQVQIERGGLLRLQQP